MKRTVLLLTLLLTGLLTSSLAMAQTEWAERVNEDGIVVKTRESAQGYVEFIATGTINKNYEEVANLLYDYQNHKGWWDSMERTELIKDGGKTQKLCWYEIYVPWPLVNRDMVSQLSWKKESDGSLTMNLKSIPNGKEETDYVRIGFAEGFWRVTPKPDGTSMVTYQYQADPGSIPNWVVDMFITDGPVASIEEMRKVLASGKYSGKKVTWL